MATVTELELPQVDLFDPGLRGERFHAAMAGAAARGWLAASPLGPVVLDREACAFFLRSKATTFPGQRVAEVFGVDDGPLREEIDRNILHLNGEPHRRLRNAVNPAFTPRAADRWRPVMREHIAAVWDELGAATEAEAVRALAKPYPSRVIASVVGAPVEDWERLHEWSNWIQRQFSADLADQRARIERSCVELYAYLDDLVAQRRAEPRDDLISELAERLDDVELTNLVLNVLIGGIDTTQSQLAHGLRLFAEHPDQWRALAADPQRLASQAVDEVVRHEPVTPFTARICLEDLEFRGVTFPRDTIVLVAAVCANREGVGETFDALDPDRDRSKPYTFGAGIHYCLGANLARAELEEAFAFLAPRMPGLALDGDPGFDSVHGIYGLLELRVRWGGSPGADPELPEREGSVFRTR